MAKLHSKKEVNAAIEYALSRDWSLVEGSGHALYTLRCPRHDRSGCQVRVASTPRNAGDHAKDLIRKIEACPHL